MQRTKFENIEKGNLIALVTFAVVKAVEEGFHEKISVIDADNRTEFNIQGKDLIEQVFSADAFETTEKASKTEMAQKLISAINKPFTVVYEKADKSLRTLRGRLIRPEPLLGRSMVEDLDNEASGNRTRLVDHRTIISLIVDGVKYSKDGK